MTHFDLTAAAGLSLRMSTPDHMVVGPEWPLLAGAYVVGARATPPIEGQPDIHLVLEEAPPFALVPQSNGYTVRGPWQGVLPDDAYHILHALARLKWLEKGLFAAHAACVVVNGKAVLLVGPSGSGKSTVAMALMARGATVFAGNTTLLGPLNMGPLMAQAGTDVCTLRADASAAHTLCDAVPYGERVAARFLNPMTGPLQIQAIAIIRLNDGVTEARRLNPRSALHTLYPILMDAMNADVIVGDGAGVVCGTPPAGCQTLLAGALSRLTQTLPVWHVAGSLEHITRVLEGTL